MPEPDDPIKVYLDYLDKEMTIMGILSTFCVAAAALVIDRVSSAEHTYFFGRLATDHPVQVYIGSGFLLAAGLCFYLQRSRLAHFYGSICMSRVMPSVTEWKSTERWLVEAYSWAPWLRYRIAFLFLILTSVVYIHVIYQEIYPVKWSLWWLEWTLLGLSVIGISLHTLVKVTYRYENHPWHHFSFKTFRADWRKREHFTGRLGS